MLSYRNTFKRISSGSEDEDSDNEAKTLKPLKRKPEEGELEDEKDVKPMSEEGTTVVKRRRVNNVWASVMSENILTDDLGQCQLARGAGKYTMNRDVENYDFTRKHLDTRPYLVPHEDPTGGSDTPEVNITDLERKIGFGLSDPSLPSPPKSKSFTMEAEKSVAKKVAKEIAHKLNEPKMEIIYRAVRALGKQRMLEYAHQVKDIEDNGGMKIMNGSRRRTPGGVLFFLLKGAPISEEKRNFIFEDEPGQKQFRNKVKNKNKAHKKMEARYRKKMKFHQKKGDMEVTDDSDLPPLPTRLQLLKNPLDLDESSSSSSASKSSETSSSSATPPPSVAPPPAEMTQAVDEEAELEDGEILD